MVKLIVKRLAPDLPQLQYMSEQAAGVDLYAAVQDDLVLAPGDYRLIPTGIALEIPVGYEAQVRPRSGLAYKNGISIVNSPGTIDADYRGEIGVILINHGKQDFVIKRADRIAQLVITPYLKAEIEYADRLSDTKRGEGGFGSTGVTSRQITNRDPQ